MNDSQREVVCMAVAIGLLLYIASVVSWGWAISQMTRTEEKLEILEKRWERLEDEVYAERERKLRLQSPTLD